MNQFGTWWAYSEHEPPEQNRTLIIKEPSWTEHGPKIFGSFPGILDYDVKNDSELYDWIIAGSRNGWLTRSVSFLICSIQSSESSVLRWSCTAQTRQIMIVKFCSRRELNFRITSFKNFTKHWSAVQYFKYMHFIFNVFCILFFKYHCNIVFCIWNTLCPQKVIKPNVFAITFTRSSADADNLKTSSASTVLKPNFCYLVSNPNWTKFTIQHLPSVMVL